jgi:hypothetical protein
MKKYMTGALIKNLAGLNAEENPAKQCNSLG